MIRENEAQRMRELGVEQVQVSIYSHRPEVHDAITKLPGSLKRTIAAHPLSQVARTQGRDRQRADGAAICVDYAGVMALAKELGVALHARPHHHADDGRGHIHPGTADSRAELQQVFRNPGLGGQRGRILRPAARGRTKTSWTVSPAAPATPPATSRPTATFSPACSFPCPAATCGSRSFSISGSTLRN